MRGGVSEIRSQGKKKAAHHHIISAARPRPAQQVLKCRKCNKLLCADIVLPFCAKQAAKKCAHIQNTPTTVVKYECKYWRANTHQHTDTHTHTTLRPQEEIMMQILPMNKILYA